MKTGDRKTDRKKKTDRENTVDENLSCPGLKGLQDIYTEQH